MIILILLEIQIFLSVINLFADIKRLGISESEFPSGIICISDCEFNPTDLNKTNLDKNV